MDADETSLPVGHTSASPMSRDSGTEKEVIPKLTLRTLLICIFISKEQSIMSLFPWKKHPTSILPWSFGIFTTADSSKSSIWSYKWVVHHGNALFSSAFSAKRISNEEKIPLLISLHLAFSCSQNETSLWKGRILNHLKTHKTFCAWPRCWNMYIKSQIKLPCSLNVCEILVAEWYLLSCVQASDSGRLTPFTNAHVQIMWHDVTLERYDENYIYV